MQRNVQIKIILLFSIIGILIITGLGFFFINSMNNINVQIGQNNLNSLEEISNMINIANGQAKISIIIALIVFGIISLIVGAFIAKTIVKPINKLIESAKQIASGEEIEISKKEIGKDNNEVEGLINAFGIMTTELKDKLSEVSKQKNQIETILLHMTDGLIAFDMEGDIILINPAAKNLLNIAPEKNNFNEIFKSFDVDINLEKIIYLENWTSYEQRISVEDKFINVFFAPFKNENDRPGGVIAVIQDITEHVKLDNMRKEFVADVSHELKTPITSIMGYADTLLEGEYDKETQEKFLNVIATEARRMAKLVTDLLTLSKFDNNQNRTQKEEFDLGDLVKKCQDKLAIEAKKKNHKVDCFVTADVPPVYADKYDIERVVLNIISNSIKYTKDNGEIKIYVGFVYNDAYIKVFDNGIGIPEEDLGRIFERFYRVDKARTRQMGGTGLGLSIAKEILDKNGGSIDIKSEVGKGTEVVIRIPTKEVKKNNEEITNV